MTVVRVTKEQIVEAIGSEMNLDYGNWIAGPFDSVTIEEAKYCPVCAVGAVMRNLVLDRSQMVRAVWTAATEATEPYEVTDGDVEELIDRKMWLNALSCFFEELSESTLDMSYVQAETIDFVQKRFPPTILINIDGTKPATGIEIVEP